MPKYYIDPRIFINAISKEHLEKELEFLARLLDNTGFEFTSEFWEPQLDE